MPSILGTPAGRFRVVAIAEAIFVGRAADRHVLRVRRGRERGRRAGVRPDPRSDLPALRGGRPDDLVGSAVEPPASASSPCWPASRPSGPGRSRCGPRARDTWTRPAVPGSPPGPEPRRGCSSPGRRPRRHDAPGPRFRAIPSMRARLLMGDSAEQSPDGPPERASANQPCPPCVSLARVRAVVDRRGPRAIRETRIRCRDYASRMAARIVICGAGAIGSSVAYFLTRRGATAAGRGPGAARCGRIGEGGRFPRRSIGTPGHPSTR